MCRESERERVSTHPVPAQIVDHASEDGVPALGDGHVLQRVQEVGLQPESWNRYISLLET
ncbi:hypothetical protein J6590_019513 [Homalodisca vitripennis]|nr:hypothetical protein J6590_019513 [Homalodisca vitripennis]